MDEERSIPDLAELLKETLRQSSTDAYGFSDWRAAQTILRRIDSLDHQGLSAIFPFLLTALSSAAGPDRSLVNFERFLDRYGPGLFSALEKNPRIIEILVTLFSASPFLTEILLQTPDAFELLNDRQALTGRKTIEQFQSEASSEVRLVETDDGKLDALRKYQRRQFLRIGADDFLGLYDLQAVLSQLSRLAIGMVRACLALAAQQTGISLNNFVVIALGKLGGWELNYSSDIDLLFVAKNDVDGYIKLAERLIKIIASTTSEGFLYRVDLRLRPWGKDGPLITSPEVYSQYIQQHARLWEKQALLKSRSIAGNLSFGEEWRKEIEPFLFSAPADEIRYSIFAMKQRTEEILREKGRRWGEVKLGEGSIRDVEFVVQLLQLTHPSARSRATLKGIRQLKEKGWLTSSEGHILTEGYSFLRTLEHYLQMIDYRQTDTLPSDPTALALLARRLGFEGVQAGEKLVERYEQHCRAIRTVFLKYVGKDFVSANEDNERVTPMLLQHIARMDVSYTAAFSQEEIQQHTQLVNSIDNESIVAVVAKSLDATQWRVTIVSYDYLGELSLICGLMFVYGLDILDSQAFTYEPSKLGETVNKEIASLILDPRRKIVDVFTVRPVHNASLTSETWNQYADDLRGMLIQMQAGQRRAARGMLVKRVGEVFQRLPGKIAPLYPIEIEIDNNLSDAYTVLKIGTTDAVGFLFELSNALAMNRINIARMFVQSIGNRVNDVLYVTDDKGGKISSPEMQRELRAATVLIKHFTHLLPTSPNPESALLHFREFLGQLFDRPNWPDELVNLERPEVLDALARLLGVSDFLWDDFLRMQYSNLFPVVRDVDALALAKDRFHLRQELAELLAHEVSWRIGLNAFKDREMFRIDMRHILGYVPEFWEFSDELTDLVEVVLSEVFRRCMEELTKRYGEPLLEDGNPCPVTVFALGKCGGRELGFASDIELMFIYRGSGKTRGSNIISTSDFFEELVRSITNSIQARQEGIFHIDLQLRPYGKAGSLAVSQDAFERYFSALGPAWAYERQALVKLRPIVGDDRLGDKVCKLRDSFIYAGEPFNVTAMRAMRERQTRQLVIAGTFNAKYSPGGLVDLEYLVQGLQIAFGAEIPALRLTNIRLAMAALSEAGILSAIDYGRLRKAHTFLSWLIDSLRVVRGNTKDVNIPEFGSEEFSFLARRLQYGADINRLREDLIRYPTDVLELNQQLLTISTGEFSRFV